MRRLVGILMTIAVVSAVGCAAQPPAATNPFACASGPVDLGPAHRVEAVSADGSVLVVATYDLMGRATYDVIDRRWAERHKVKTTSENSVVISNEEGRAILHCI